MVWLLTEILVYVAAAAVFGGLIGLGLAGSGTKRRALAFQREHQGLIDRVQTYERTQRLVEAKAAARGAAEAAARGDLEARLVEMEGAAAEYRARAEAAERRLRNIETPGVASGPVEAPGAAEEGAPILDAGDAALAKPLPDLRRIEAERALGAAEIESLRAQLAEAERARARAEIDLAVAQARAEESLRAARRARETQAEVEHDPPEEGERPPGLPGPRDGKPDDLRRIRGIGPKNEGVLNSLGIYHYEQVAALTPAHVAWLDSYLKYHGRIARDDWVGQAQALVGAEPGAADKVHPQDVGA
jgi:predicted flap endonuclease-1-like 5' DNA nuclease